MKLSKRLFTFWRIYVCSKTLSGAIHVPRTPKGIGKYCCNQNVNLCWILIARLAPSVASQCKSSAVKMPLPIISMVPSYLIKMTSFDSWKCRRGWWWRRGIFLLCQLLIRFCLWVMSCTKAFERWMRMQSKVCYNQQQFFLDRSICNRQRLNYYSWWHKFGLDLNSSQIMVKFKRYY